MDRRRHPRVAYGAWVEDVSQSGQTQFYLAHNLSLGGLLLEAKVPPPIGHLLFVRLVIENESRVMGLGGVVIRHIPSPDGAVGTFVVRFLGPTSEETRFLIDLQQECAPASAEPALDGMDSSAERNGPASGGAVKPLPAPGRLSAPE